MPHPGQYIKARVMPKTVVRTLLPIPEGKEMQQNVSALVGRMTTIVFVYPRRLTKCKKEQKK